MSTLAVFDKSSRVQAFLRLKDGRIEAEFLPEVDTTDIQAFLAGLDQHDPELKREGDGIFWLERISKEDPRYLFAVMSTMKLQGFDPYPIEEYQKKLLIALNAKELDAVREGALGDLLGIPEAEIDDFLRDLKEGMSIMQEKK